MSNADQAELNKFEQVAAQWWNPESEFKPLHQMNPVRANWIDQKVDGLDEKVVIDIGCGGGLLCEAMAVRGARSVQGIDLGPTAIGVAQTHAKQQGFDQIQYQLSSAEQWAEQYPATYDVVTCMEMLEHVPDPNSIVESVSKLLKPGGRAVFSTLNRNPKSWLFSIVGAEYVLKLLPKGTHDYNKFIRPSELATSIRKNGLILLESTGLHYNPLTQSFRTGPGTDVNYMMVCEKPNE